MSEIERLAHEAKQLLSSIAGIYAAQAKEFRHSRMADAIAMSLRHAVIIDALAAAKVAGASSAEPVAMLQATPGLKRHALEAAEELSKYAAAPFFPDTEVRGIVRATTAEWWDGLAELIEQAQPLIGRAKIELTEPHPLAPTPSDPQAEVDELRAAKDAAYLERNQVVAALAKCFPSGVARTAIDGWSEDWHGCVYIDLPTGQASWHFHDSQAYLFDGLPQYAGKWDGHSTPEKYERIAALAAHPSAQPVPARAWHFEFMADRRLLVTDASGKTRTVWPEHIPHGMRQLFEDMTVALAQPVPARQPLTEDAIGGWVLPGEVRQRGELACLVWAIRQAERAHGIGTKD